MKQTFILTGIFVVVWSIVILFSFGDSYAEQCKKNQNVVVHKYQNGKMTQQTFTTNYYFSKNESRELIQKKIKEQVFLIVWGLMENCKCEYFVVNFVDAYCSVKNIFYNTSTGNSSLMSRTFPKSAHAKKGGN